MSGWGAEAASAVAAASPGPGWAGSGADTCPGKALRREGFVEPVAGRAQGRGCVGLIHGEARSQPPFPRVC